MFRSLSIVIVSHLLVSLSVAVQDSCELMDASCETQVAGGEASLLQKVFKKENKAVVADIHEHSKQPMQPDACSGVAAQGKCWFLSELGESCSATCAKQGKAFDYVIADASKPVTPILVGHEPNTKQAPWAAVECYAPSEDRYHPANANAAKHIEEDIGAWTHEECKLACPCSNMVAPVARSQALQMQCSWKQPAACADAFEWKGRVYSGCASVDMEHDRPWCQHGYKHTELKDDKDWSYCTYECPTQAPTLPPAPVAVPASAPAPAKENCKWIPASTCVNEYAYKGSRYSGCTATDHNTAWCSNTDPYSGLWNNCISSCAVQPVAVPVPELQCSWQAGSECAAEFEYKGVLYSGCTTVDHPTPWCSKNSIHQGDWTTCQKVCTQPPTPVPVQPAPSAPSPQPQPMEEDPCVRHADAENDVIGATVTLDEAGYKIAAAAESPINMKRFVCRVVGKLECRVTDLASLMAFVPYYNGLMAEQTYRHLNSELETLCHSGGKWIVPLTDKYWSAP